MKTPSESSIRHAAPSAPDIALARIASRDLAASLASAPGRSEIKVRFVVNDHAEDVALPCLAVRLLADILGQMAKGNAVTIIPVQAELSTREAAEFLNVSRPFVTKLLKNGEISYRQVGTHRRVRIVDLLLYKKKTEVEQGQVLADLVAQAQNLNLGY